MNDLTKIEIWWQGPYTKAEVEKHFANSDSSYGIYQIYGTHNISGPNTLLYVGKASRQTFATRLMQHDWTEWEASEAQFFIGQLGGQTNIAEEIWEQHIDIAERLLIYFCAPPYNSSGLNDYGNIHNTIVLNLNKKNRLPFEVSTLYEDSKAWEKDWNIYKMIGKQ